MPPTTSSALLLDEQQQDALYMLLNEPCGVVTGPPGTGKSAILRSFLEQSQGGHVVLLAPTGKAARRITELTGKPAHTIHRWVLQDHDDIGSCVVVIDEASMLDVETMATLSATLRCTLAFGCKIRLFFIGDANQLPSVGPGNLLQDIINADRVPVVELRTVYRSAEGSWMCGAATEILQGRFPWAPDPGFTFIEANNSDEVKQALQAYLHRDSRDMVMVPQNVGSVGSAALNTLAQAILNPEHPGQDYFTVNMGKAGKHLVRAGDKVICGLNDYERKVFNGDQGVVTWVEGRGDGSVLIDFGTPIGVKSYSKTEAADDFRLAYVLSTHKCQGSEAPRVVFVVTMEHAHMLTRRLFYTAITRAQKEVIIIGQREAVEHAVANTRDEERITTLEQRLRGVVY